MDVGADVSAGIPARWGDKMLPGQGPRATVAGRLSYLRPDGRDPDREREPEMDTETKSCLSQQRTKRNADRRDRDTGRRLSKEGAAGAQAEQQGQLRWEQPPELVWRRGWFGQQTRGLGSRTEPGGKEH